MISLIVLLIDSLIGNVALRMPTAASADGI